MATDTPLWQENDELWIDGEAAGEAFQEYRGTLMTAITESAILPLANNLYSHGIISQANLSHAQMTTLIPEERKVHLFDSIEARIRSKPEDFFILLNILDNELVFRDHAVKLREAYKVCPCYIQM